MADNVFAIGNTSADVVNIGGNATDINLGDDLGNVNVAGNLRIGGLQISSLSGEPIITWAGSPTSVSIPGNLDTNGNLAVDGNSVVQGSLTVGNLVVLGTSTVTSTANLLVTDKLITVSYGATNAASVDQSGINVGYVNASILYGTSDDSWTFNRSIQLGLNDLVTSGNVTVGNLNVINFLTGTLTTGIQNNITSVGTLSSLSVSGNITASSSVNVTTSVRTPSITSSTSLSMTTTSGNITLTPSSGRYVDFTNAILYSPKFRNYSEYVLSLGDWSGNFTPNYNTGVVKKIKLIGSLNLLPISNFPTGGSMTIIIEQDSVGSRLMTPDASYKWAAGSNILSTTPGAIDIINIFYDGVITYAALSKGYV